MELLYFIGQFFLNLLLYAIQAFALFFTIYQTIISYLGFRKREFLEIKNPEKKFAIIIPAHNEERVIGQILDSIEALDYPKKLYDTYVICDNCTDKTAEIAKHKNAISMIRTDEEHRGKGYALKWMFEKLWKLEQENGVHYDAVVLFDADNLISKNFLKIVNSKLLEGHEVIQSYLDSKNPRDTWITQAYAFSYWATNRIFQLSRENLGLSAQLGGTGVVINTRVLKEIGWGATSLTEDLEFTQQYILRSGKRIAWAHDAKVYDEKPLTFSASWKQRIRWMSGHVDCMSRYTIPLIKATIKTKNLLYLDSAVYLMQPSRLLISLIILIFTVLSFLDLVFVKGIIDKWLYLLITLGYHMLPVIGLIMEKQFRAIFWIVRTYLFSYTWLPIVVLGILRRKNRIWDHTKHTRNLSIGDIETSTDTGPSSKPVLEGN